MEKHHLMIGVPRFDGVHSADNLVEAITAGVTQIASQHTEQAPPVRVLPERIHLHELDPNPPGPESDYRTRWEIPIGLRETDLTPAHCHMHTNPHLLIFGAAKSGKTTIAHAIARAICARNSPQQVRFMLADYRSGLLDAVPDTHLLGAGAINRNSASLDEAVQALAVNLKKRLPPTDLTTAQLRSRSWWSGFDVVLLVDDWHMIVGAAGDAADGTTGPAIAGGGRYRVAHHCHLSDEPGLQGNHGQVRRRRIRVGRSDNVPFGREAGIPIQ